MEASLPPNTHVSAVAFRLPYDVIWARLTDALEFPRLYPHRTSRAEGAGGRWRVWVTWRDGRSANQVLVLVAFACHNAGRGFVQSHGYRLDRATDGQWRATLESESIT